MTAEPSVPSFSAPPYPYDLLVPLKALAESHEGGLVDLSVGDPKDAPPDFVSAALAWSETAGRYPASVGFLKYREAAAGWILRRFGVEVSAEAIAACIGTKELVASLPYLLKLRTPAKDTVLYPSVSYPTYEMGAIV